MLLFTPVPLMLICLKSGCLLIHHSFMLLRSGQPAFFLIRLGSPRTGHYRVKTLFALASETVCIKSENAVLNNRNKGSNVNAVCIDKDDDEYISDEAGLA